MESISAQQKLTRVACLVLVDLENHVFITRRPENKSLGGYWEFAGGKIEVGESEEEALRRELYEELRLSIGKLTPVESVRYRYEFGMIELHPFFARCDIRPDFSLIEHSDAAWVGLAELLSRKLAPADIPIAESIGSLLKEV